jgi:glycerate kinase
VIALLGRHLLEGCPIVLATDAQRSRPALLAVQALGPRIDAERVAAALARGLIAGGLAQPEVCPIDVREAPQLASQPRRGELERRLRAARALILALALLDARELARSPAFELATRARQAGVPCYAVVRENRLGTFDARMLDLQLIIEARDEDSLTAAGRALAEVI